MTEKELRKQLKDFRISSKVIELKEKELDKLEKGKMDLISPQSTKYSHTPKSTAISDPVFMTYFNISSNFDALISKVKLEIKLLMRERREVENAISELPSIYKVVVQAHYLNGKRWDVVARELSYSERQIFYIHKSAIETMLLYINNSINVA